MSVQLENGDVSFQPSFNLIGWAPGKKITRTFKPPKGQQFAVLLLGVAPNDAQTYDFDAALNALGYFRADQQAKPAGEAQT